MEPAFTRYKIHKDYQPGKKGYKEILQATSYGSLKLFNFKIVLAL